MTRQLVHDRNMDVVQTLSHQNARETSPSGAGGSEAYRGQVFGRRRGVDVEAWDLCGFSREGQADGGRRGGQGQGREGEEGHHLGGFRVDGYGRQGCVGQDGSGAGEEAEEEEETEQVEVGGAGIGWGWTLERGRTHGT